MYDTFKLTGSLFIVGIGAMLLLALGAAFLGTGGGTIVIEHTYPNAQIVAEPYVPYAPVPEEIKLRSHAVESHGEDAELAREGIRLCSNLEAYYCGPTTTHPISRYILVCRNNSGWCCGMIVNNQAVEVTAWCAPCDRWEAVAIECLITQARRN